MPAGDNFFVDTNLLLCFYDRNDPAKQEMARAWVHRLWVERRARISWQVLNEFYTNAASKMKIPVAEIRSAVEEFHLWQPLTPGIGELRRAWHWCDAAQVGFWDALILAAAEQSGCPWLLSEDFQTGRKYGSVTVVNPFKSKPSEFGL